jgi:hypothetical protein
MNFKYPMVEIVNLYIIIYRCYIIHRRATGWMARVRFPAYKDLSLLYSVQTDPGAHPVSYPMGTGSDFPGSTAAGA